MDSSALKNDLHFFQYRNIIISYNQSFQEILNFRGNHSDRSITTKTFSWKFWEENRKFWNINDVYILELNTVVHSLIISFNEYLKSGKKKLFIQYN